VNGKNLNSGIRGGIWDEKHRAKMGEAIWLFGWLIHRQTKQSYGEGLVLRGMLLTYDAIAEDTGYPAETVRRWMRSLRDLGYIGVKHGSYKKLVIRIRNAKKLDDKQLSMLDAFRAPVNRPAPIAVAQITIAKVMPFPERQKPLGKVEVALLREIFAGSGPSDRHQMARAERRLRVVGVGD
jgi:hypothetical protein